MTINETLKKLGLTNNASNVYLSLLRIKSGSASEIAKSAKIARTLVYSILSLLENQGLIGSKSKNNKKLWFIEPPSKLNNLLIEKEIAYKKILPDLNDIFLNYNNDSEKKISSIEEVKEVVDRLLSNENELRVIGCLFKFNTIINSNNLVDRLKKRTNELLILDSMSNYSIYNELFINNSHLPSVQIKITKEDLFAHYLTFLVDNRIYVLSNEEITSLKVYEDKVLYSITNTLFNILFMTSTSPIQAENFI